MVSAAFIIRATAPPGLFRNGTIFGAIGNAVHACSAGTALLRARSYPAGAAFSALVDYAVVAELVDAQR